LRPRLPDRVGHDRLDLVVGELLGKVFLDQARLGLLAFSAVGASALAIGASGLEASLALSLQHRDLALLVEVEPCLLRFLPEGIEQ
jgi:hypothetical protein